jgi:hypothetical protein
MNNDTSSLVNDLLNILQPDEPVTQPEKKEQVVKEKANQQPEKKVAKASLMSQPKAIAKPITKAEGFLSDINENVKDTQNAKVVIRKDLYEVYMSLKRAKQVKSVSTLLDYALEDYIKRNSENIKQLLYDSQNNAIL